MANITDGSGFERNFKQHRWEGLTRPYKDSFLPADECMPDCEHAGAGCMALKCDYFDRVVTRLGEYENTGVPPADAARMKNLLARDSAVYAVNGMHVAVEGSAWHAVATCPMCGGELVANASFCHHCGQRIKWEE